MGRLFLVSAAVLMGATACGSAMSFRSATPLRNIVVYAKPESLDPNGSQATTIWRARLDGSHAKQLASGGSPAVSPDGRLIAFGRGADLLVMPAAGGAAERVYTFRGKDAGLGDIPTTWAPDSRHLAFGTSGGLAVLDVLSHRVHLLPQADFSFAFSPDSRKIVYDSRGRDLYVVSALGGKPVRLTFDHRSTGPVWGKPGIAFSRYAEPHAEIWLSDGTKHQPRQLTRAGTDAGPVVFSADGTKLLAAYWPAHAGRLWAVDVATGVEHPITPWVGDLYPQGLSAGGSMVLAVVGCGDGAMYGSVEAIPVAGGKPHVIVNGPCSASWNAG